MDTQRERINSLINITGTTIKDKDGEIVGSVVEIRYTKNNEIEYLIMESSAFFGSGNRYFAIPASDQFITAADKNNVVLHLHKDEIPFARGVAADECPKPNLEFGSSMFELYGYHVPAKLS